MAGFGHGPARAADPPAAAASLGDRKMNRALTGALAATLVAGVSACQAPLEWYKAGVSSYDYAADVSYCDGAKQQVAAYTPDDEMYLVRLYEIDAYNNCMEARGYELVEPGTRPQTGAAPVAMPGAKQ
jgi:hypothetical protein